nr:Mut7-C RNAse domain-containing protein [Streptomyces sp. SID3343]
MRLPGGFDSSPDGWVKADVRSDIPSVRVLATRRPRVGAVVGPEAERSARVAVSGGAARAGSRGLGICRRVTGVRWDADPVNRPDVLLQIPTELQPFLSPRQRGLPVNVPADGDSTLGHIVESAGPPLPEVGRLLVDGREVQPGYRPVGGEVVDVFPIARPQAVPEFETRTPRFLLDVHLGALARRMRLVGIDTAYHNDCDDPTLVVQANAERRVLLTQDRGLLRRKNLWFGAYVYGIRADVQLDDLLRRFALTLAPWTRCTACNGELRAATREEVEPEVKPGTLDAVESFARCRECARVYWHGAHGGHLDEIVEAAQRVVASVR